MRSRNLKEKMESQADPCDDFYDYACGRWTRKGLPGNHAVEDVFSSMAEKIEDRMKELLENQKENEGNAGSD